MRAERLLVVGCGGIGGVVTGHLLASGRTVAVVAHREAIAQALRERGVTLVESATERRLGAGDGSLEVHLRAPAEGAFDFILLTVPPDGVEAAAKQTVHLLAPGGHVVCFQNGLCEERVARIVGPGRVLGAVVSWGASMLGPGRYEKTSSGPIAVGALEGPRDEGVARLAALLSPIGPVRVTDNLAGARWSKLAVNCAVSSLGTAAGERLGAVLVHRFARRLALEVISEAVAVARAKGVRLERLVPGVELGRLALTAGEREGGLSHAASLVAKHGLLLVVGARYRRLRSSMLAALERGRTPSVDFLNGEVVTHGRDVGVPTPVNARLQALIHSLAEGRARPSFETLRRLYDETR